MDDWEVMRENGWQCMIRSDVKLGSNVIIYHKELVNLYGCEIGDNTKIGAFVEIRDGVVVGSNCKIQAFVFIPEGVQIEDGVFIGPHVCFINDLYPRATDRGRLKEPFDWEVVPTVVKRGASIGANATILCGVTIGQKAMIAAGSVVTRDVPDGAVVMGRRARTVRMNGAGLPGN